LGKFKNKIYLYPFFKFLLLKNLAGEREIYLPKFKEKNYLKFERVKYIQDLKLLQDLFNLNFFITLYYIYTVKKTKAEWG